MRLSGHVARMGEGRTCTGFWWESSRESHLKDQGIDGWMGSRWTIEILDGGVEWIHLAQILARVRILAPRSSLIS
jgi:hypothetical protein